MVHRILFIVRLKALDIRQRILALIRHGHELKLLGRGQAQADGASILGKGVNKVPYFNLGKFSTWVMLHCWEFTVRTSHSVISDSKLGPRGHPGYP